MRVLDISELFRFEASTPASQAEEGSGNRKWRRKWNYPIKTGRVECSGLVLTGSKSYQ